MAAVVGTDLLGFTFLVRDFLGQGAPAPLGGFCAVLDKVGGTWMDGF